MKRVFNNYLKKFNKDDEMIFLKISHSIRVMNICELLANSMDFNEREKYLLKILGLFHDIGRFTQVEEYRTFDDLNSIDHAEIGYKIFLKDIVPCFDLTTDEVKKISMAIKYHNKVDIGRQSSEDIKYSKIIRDADKIDILYMASNIQGFLKSYTNLEVSPIVRDSFFNHKLVNNSDIKNEKDKIIRLLAFFWDINYKESAKIIKENKYYNKLQSKMKNENLDEYFEEIDKFLKEVKNGNKI